MSCCGDGCTAAPMHSRTIELTAEWCGIDAMTLEISFCCDHLDALLNEDPPFLDFTVGSRFRG